MGVHQPSQYYLSTVVKQVQNDKAILISDSDDSESTTYNKKEPESLHSHANKVIDFTSRSHLEVDRTSKELFWNIVMSFYKSCIDKPEKLTKELVIHFVNESGADTGALRREFFEEALAEANYRLLEGDDNKRMIKKDWSMGSVYRMLGTLVAHSILQNGPGLWCLSPVIMITWLILRLYLNLMIYL